MRRVLKNHDSEVIKNNLNYIEGNSNNNLKISKVLYKEQKGFCSYTEEYLGRADARDIEHFNPNLKGTIDDSYSNWFLVKHQWNIEKASKWENLQPVLNPAAIDFEDRIVYDSGDYRVSDLNDNEAINLIKLLKLDDIILADERKKYIQRKTKELSVYGVSAEDFFKILIEDDIKQISYLRAIQEEFNIDIWNMIPELK
ncbi:HNH endonuclease domain-containing protein [Flavobacterium marginilacus]|uniref:HNH endonuclease domain-containing protein n=1 Tax=Flavobacterium marginilacus TaxID=3003256 RepID=UPI00248DDE6C|nr:HNH endonuclease domain-containing protein [Flavobacterium marginilacus]